MHCEIQNDLDTAENGLSEVLEGLRSALCDQYDELEKRKSECVDCTRGENPDEELMDLIEESVRDYKRRQEEMNEQELDPDDEFTAEEEELIIKIADQYDEDLENRLSEIETFEQAKECSYLYYYGAGVIRDVIDDGLKLEDLIKNIESLIKNNF